MVRSLFGLIGIVAWASVLHAAAPKPAYELLPQSSQAVIWLPNSEVLTDRWNRTQLAQLAEDPQIREFWNDQQGQIEQKLTSAGWRLHIQPRDLGEIVSGQIALAWIEKREVVRKPFAIAMIVDVVQREMETAEFLKKLDSQLKERGSQRNQLTHAGINIVQHTLKPQNGELLPQETFYAVVAEQLMASDDLQTLQGLIDTATGKSTEKKLDQEPAFTKARSELKLDGQGQLEYFVRPLGFARVLRAISRHRSGGKADILAVLQSEGFDKLQAVCGEVRLGEPKYDLLHRGFVLVPEPFKDRPVSVQLLDFPNEAKSEIPAWISDRVSSVFAGCWNVREAFWKAESLVNAMAGDPRVFEQIIQGIKVDPTGPQIDIREQVMPLLTNDVFAISEAKLPIDVDSKRNLIALRVTNAGQMSKILDKAMKTEPDAKEIQLKGHKVWKVQRNPEDEVDLDFGDDFNGAGKNATKEDNQPLLSNWAITVYDGFLLFASHEDMIADAIDQAKAGKESPLIAQDDYSRIMKVISDAISDAPICAWRINRSALAYRAQYELFKAGKLEESKGMYAMVLEHLIESKTEIEPKKKKPVLDGSKLPDYSSIIKYLQPSGTYVRTVDNGWNFGSILLSKDTQSVEPTKENSSTSSAANKPVQNAATKR